MAYVSESMASSAQQQARNKYDKGDTDWLSIFIQLAPAGYDAYKGYSDWKLSQLANPEYVGMKGLMKFMSNPSEAGMSIAHAKKMISDEALQNNISIPKARKALEKKIKNPEVKKDLSNSLGVEPNIKDVDDVQAVDNSDMSGQVDLSELISDDNITTPIDKKVSDLKGDTQGILGKIKPIDKVSESASNTIKLAGDVGNISNLIKNPSIKLDNLQDVNRLAQGTKSGVDVLKGGKDILTEMFLDKTKNEASKKVAKEVAKEATKEVTKKSGETIIPGLDLISSAATIADKDANIGQKIGSGIDATGTGMLATPAAPIAPFVKLGGKAINLISSLFPKGRQTMQPQTRDLAAEADRKKRLLQMLNRNRA